MNLIRISSSFRMKLRFSNVALVENLTGFDFLLLHFTRFFFNLIP